MSHPGNTDFISGNSEKIAVMATEEGADGIVAPATHPERIQALKKMMHKVSVPTSLNPHGTWEWTKLQIGRLKEPSVQSLLSPFAIMRDMFDSLDFRFEIVLF